jgi:voltage-gated potassium channel
VKTPSPSAGSTEPFKHLYRRTMVALVALLTVLVLGTAGYHYLGDGRWEVFDCFYMAVVTLSTVGFAETLPGMQQVPEARYFTVLLIVLGSGTLLYFVSTFTAFIVEGDLMGALRRNRMNKRIAELEDHVVVCGIGSTGIHIVEELVAIGAPFVAIDIDEQRLRKLDEEEFPQTELHYVVGDATDDHVLDEAGIRRARGVIAALHDDKDNLFVTISARALNPRARIVAKAVEASTDNKLRRAGADSVVSPNRIGGFRLVSEMVRPEVMQFLDVMLRDKQRNLRIEELLIPERSTLVGAQLRNTDIRRKTDVLVIAIRTPDGEFVYNPGPDTVIQKHSHLIVLGETAEVRRLREGVEKGSIGLAM